MKDNLPLNTILIGDSVKQLQNIPDNSIDLIFADPPYYLQLEQDLFRPNMTKVDGVDDEWDKFEGFKAYDEFSKSWLKECQRVLSKNGTIWVIGSYHNIFRIGTIMQDLGFWILNDVIWLKTNPMPNFRGVRFTNAHETLIWASKNKKSKYTFNHHAIKSLNDDLQMRSDWLLPLCTGPERIKINGKKAHSTQKPEALLYRVILSSSNPGDVVLDPFFGSGTTGAVAKVLHRDWIGIEREQKYVEIAQQRMEGIIPPMFEPEIFDIRDKKKYELRIPFGNLLENGMLSPGQSLYFQADKLRAAKIISDGKLLVDGFEGSIHQVGSHLMNGNPCNGWVHWYYENDKGELVLIDKLRELARSSNSKT